MRPNTEEALAHFYRSCAEVLPPAPRPVPRPKPLGLLAAALGAAMVVGLIGLWAGSPTSAYPSAPAPWSRPESLAAAGVSAPGAKAPTNLRSEVSQWRA